MTLPIDTVPGSVLSGFDFTLDLHGCLFEQHIYGVRPELLHTHAPLGCKNLLPLLNKQYSKSSKSLSAPTPLKSHPPPSSQLGLQL